MVEHSQSLSLNRRWKSARNLPKRSKLPSNINHGQPRMKLTLQKLSLDGVTNLHSLSVFILYSLKLINTMGIKGLAKLLSDEAPDVGFDRNVTRSLK